MLKMTGKFLNSIDHSLKVTATQEQAYALPITKVTVIPNVTISDALLGKLHREVVEMHGEIEVAHEHIHQDKTNVEGMVLDTFTYKEAANQSMVEAAKSEVNAKASEVASKQSEIAADASATVATNKATESAQSAAESLESEWNAQASEQLAHAHMVAANESELASAQSESNALNSEQAAKVSETNSKASETASKQSEINAKASEVAANDDATATAEDRAHIDVQVDVVDGYRAEALDSKNQAHDSKVASANSAAASLGSANASEQSAIASEVSNKESEEWAIKAQQYANQTFISGGLWNPSLGQEYPDVSAITRDTLWIVDLTHSPNTKDLPSYTFETGALAGKAARTGMQMFYDTPQNTWFIIDTVTAGVTSINGEFGVVTLDHTDVGAISTEQFNTFVASNTEAMNQVQTQLDDTYTQVEVDTKDKAISDSLAEQILRLEELVAKAESLQNQHDELEQTIADESWHHYCQNEAQMNAHRQQNMEQFAASGFVHYGKHNASNTGIVNEGMWTYTNADDANIVFMGRELAQNPTGTSKTFYPVTNIAGFISKILDVNRRTSTTPNRIKFPDAPNGTVIYDSTGKCRGNQATLNLLGDIDPKYGDTTNDVNEAVARAFEGKVCNGNFRAGVSAYWGVAGGGSITKHAQGALISANGNLYGGAASSQNIYIDANVAVRVSCTIHACKGTGNIILRGGSGNHAKSINANSIGYFEHVFTPKTTASGNYVLIEAAADSTFECVITDISVKPLTEEVVINRVDMFGFEYWLEEVTTSNPYVYPYGMIQSQATSMNGLPTTDVTAKPITYFAVFDGDTTSQGKGVNFWGLSNADKIKLVEDPNHNLFLIKNDRLVQWRCRQRTIAGAGNGKWDHTNPAENDPTEINFTLSWKDSKPALRVKPQGYRDTPHGGKSLGDYAPDSSSPSQVSDYMNPHGPAEAWVPKPVGIFTARNNQIQFAVDDMCYFQVCGVVPRLNQGAYHPSFNPMGTKQCWRNTVGSVGNWYDPIVTPYLRSTLSCFDYDMGGSPTVVGKVAHDFSGIIGRESGRPDGKFSDAIYASGQGGVIDYRTPAKDMGSKEEASKIFQKVVNGSYRGEETLYGSKVYKLGAASTDFSVGNYRRFNCESPDMIGVDGRTHKGRGDATPHADLDSPHFGFIYDADSGKVWKCTEANANEYNVTRLYTSLDTVGAPSGSYQNLYFIASPNSTDGVVRSGVDADVIFTNIPVSGNFTQLDVIGSPAKILATPQLANGWLGGWIHQLPINGTFNAQLTRKSLVSKAYQLVTQNFGSSWEGNASKAINTTTNAVTLSTTSNDVIIESYTAFAKQTKPSTNKAILNYHEGIGDVYANSYHGITHGCLLNESLLGKVNTASKDRMRQFMKMSEIYTDSRKLYSTSTYATANNHSPVELSAPTNDSPAVKALWYQTATNQQCSLNFAWNELVWSEPETQHTIVAGQAFNVKAGDVSNFTGFNNPQFNGAWGRWNSPAATTWNVNDLNNWAIMGDNIISDANTSNPKVVKGIRLNLPNSGWGDDSTVRIVDNTSTYTNLNGVSCLYGSAELSIPFGYSSNKARAGTQVLGVDL